MPHFGRTSRERLATCHPDIQALMHRCIQVYDFSIICGHRGEAAQTEAFVNGFSKVQFPNSKHNQDPSRAVDIAPYPIDWNDKKRFYYLAGLVMAVAHDLQLDIRWGGDWDRDGDFNDQHFMDLPHFELV